MKGFTLVELLIVIALIAILSVAVLATINPIEQSNKARDAAMKNDAAEVLSALERYYTSQNAYPWNNSAIGTTVVQGTKITIVGSDALFGVNGATVGTNGVLITTSELKSSFMSKKPFIAAADPVDRMYIYHNGTDSNYVCFVPKATANRMTGGVSNPALKCLTLGTGAGATLLNAATTNCSNDTDWTTANASDIDGGNANLLCVPEGAIAP